MALLRLSELYTSTQGEGPRTGFLTQFVRFAGCNMKCPGWPCDTPYAIDPALYRKDSLSMTALQLADKLDTKVKHLCLTGGEPFTQPEGHFQEFVELARTRGYTIECFTNGSVPIPEWAKLEMSFMLDWKLGGSGEQDTKLVERNANIHKLKRNSNIKFVIADETDLGAAIILTDAMVAVGVRAQFWVGSAWGKFEDAKLVEAMIEHNLPWRLNIQTHKHIWPEAERGV